MTSSTPVWVKLPLSQPSQAQFGLEYFWADRVHGLRQLDPYLVWSSLSKFRLVSASSPDWLPFLIETKNGAPDLVKKLANVLQGSVTLQQVIRIPSVYKRGLMANDGYKPSRYITALVHKAYLDWIRSFDEILRMQLGVARIGDVDTMEVDDIKWESNASRDFSQTDRPAAARVSVVHATDLLPVLGVIDDGCNFAHPAYQKGSNAGTKSRVVRLWDQTFGAPLWSGKPAYFGYGQVYTGNDLDAKFAASPTEQGVYKNTFGAYKSAGATVAYPAIRKEIATHGSSVMHILAGNFEAPPQQSAATLSPSDAASKADIIFVQLPRLLLDDTSSGSLCVYVMDAIRYIIDRSETYQPLSLDGKNQERVHRKICINLSYGSMSGPHDGTALLDEAIEEVVRVRQNLAITVAAGNNRKNDCHARTPLPPDSTASLGIQLSPNNPIASSVEIWIPTDSAPGFQIQLCSPSGSSSDWVRIGEVHKLSTPSTDFSALIVAPTSCALGRNKSMFLLAFHPSAVETSEEPRAEAGTWRLNLKNVSAAATEAHVWVERNDMAYAQVRRQQTCLVNWDDAYLTVEDTLCSPASSRGAISVGSHVYASRARSSYSAEGGSVGKPNPDGSAPADIGDETRGIRVAGVVSGSSTRTSGTSMAAPMVARGIANWMTKQKTPVGLADIQGFVASDFPVPPKL